MEKLCGKNTENVRVVYQEHTCFSTRGENCGEIKDLSNSSVCENVVPIFLWFKVANQLEQPDLVVNYQNHRVVLVNTLKCERGS